MHTRVNPIMCVAALEEDTLHALLAQYDRHL